MVAEPIPPDHRLLALEAIRGERERRNREAAEAERKRRQAAQIDIADWAERRYYIKETKRPITLRLHQKGVLRAMFQRVPVTGYRRFHQGIVSTIKKSGKTSLGAIICRWYAETQTAAGEIYTIGNDLKQAKGREFKMAKDSIRLTPGSRRMAGEIILPGQWRCQATKMECYTTESTIEAISVDAAGEAGAAPDLTCFTEIWGLQGDEAIEFWAEMTPVLTKPDSFRFVETYAGYSGDSVLLEEQYNLGKSGQHLTNREFAEMACREVDGERYEDMLLAFTEANGDPEAPVPIWIHETAGLFMHWDEDEPEGVARRMPWQKGSQADAYYREQASGGQLPPGEYERLHRNKWVSPLGEFIPLESWDACKETLPPFVPENKEPCVLAADAATLNDCFAIAAATRHPMREKDPAIRACKKYDPKQMGGAVDYSKPEGFLRCKVVGGCVAGHPLLPDKSGPDLRFGPGGDETAVDWMRWPEGACGACRDKVMVLPYNVLMIAYDAFQLENMMQSLRRELGVRCKRFDQIKERLIADQGLYTSVIQRHLAWDANMPGADDLREHVGNAAAKIDAQESKMRIVKKAPDKKVDLLVATSMAVREIGRLVLTAEG